MTAFRTSAYPARGGMLPQTISVVVFALFNRSAVKGVMVSMTKMTMQHLGRGEIIDADNGRHEVSPDAEDNDGDAGKAKNGRP